MSRKTANLGLHLWSEEDYVLMEEFNADHQAIDDQVTSAANTLETVRRTLVAGQQRANRNIFHLIAPQYFTSGLSWKPRAMVFSTLDSATETGVCTGFQWSEHPIHLGLYSVSLDSVAADIHDASIQKTVALEESFQHATLLVQAHGWYSRTPPLHDMAAHVEDYTGISLEASLNGEAMQSAGCAAGSYPSDTEVSLREFLFELEEDFSGDATVKIDFHCPNDRALWVYDWVLILA